MGAALSRALLRPDVPVASAAAGAIMAADSDSSSGRLGRLLGELRCPICEGYFRDPMLAGCGDSFCHVCISRAWERCRDSFPCPVCRAAFPEIRLRPNRQLRNAAESAESQAARIVWEVHWEPIDRLSIEGSPEREPCRSGFPLIEEAPSMCPGHLESLELFCSQDERPQHRGHDFPCIQNAFPTYSFRSDSPILWEERLQAHLKTLRAEREKLLGLKVSREETSQEYLKQTQAERQKIVAEFQHLRQFLEEQERLLLAQLEKLNEKIGRLQTDTVTKLSEQISRLSERIQELEGTCQKPASEFLQDVRSTLSRCEEGQAQQPEEMAPELEEQVRGFSQKVIALSESLREFKDTLPATLEKALRAHRPANVTLDPDTAHPRLVLSEDGKRVRRTKTRQPLPDSPERYDTWPCVLGREGFTSGRHYWEVEVGGWRHWAVGVASESVSRKGGISLSPEVGIWAVRWWEGHFQALTDPETPLPLRPPSRIRVCLDCDRGRVTFIDAGSKAPIFTFPPGSLPGDRIRPWLWVGWDTALQLFP